MLQPVKLIKTSTEEPIEEIPQPTYAMHVTVTVMGQVVEALFDTGAGISTCHPDLLPENHPLDTADLIPLIVANDNSVLPKGITQVDIAIGKEILTHEFRVTDEISTKMILGRDFMRRHTNGIQFQDD